MHTYMYMVVMCRLMFELFTKIKIKSMHTTVMHGGAVVISAMYVVLLLTQVD